MGEPASFKRWRREDAALRPAEQRLRDFRELRLPRTAEQSRQQGGRCMDCGVPFCEQGCPLGNQIPSWDDLIYRDRWREAYARLAATNNLPEVTGRVCPAPCEAACLLAPYDAPTTIEQNEREIVERAFAEGWVQPAPPRARSGRTVGIVGSGPAGLAAAAQLNAAGHRVTVYEADDRVGGLLRYGIPDFKLEKQILDRRVALLVAEGITFAVGARVGDDLTWHEARARHDALLVAIGAQRPRDLPVPGRDLAGICFALDYLVAQNRRVAGEPISASLLDAADKRVIILGGGDTGADCLGTALRQGASSVLQLELLSRPAAPTGGACWPLPPPLLLRDSPSHAEGGERQFGWMTTHLGGRDGRLATLHAVRVTGGAAPAGIVPVPGSETALPVDLLVLALGFVGPSSAALVEQLGVALDARGCVAVDPSYQTSVEGVFCAGDAQRGASLVVWAILEGREAACAIDSQLRGGRPSVLPSRGMDAPFKIGGAGKTR